MAALKVIAAPVQVNEGKTRASSDIECHTIPLVEDDATQNDANT